MEPGNFLASEARSALWYADFASPSAPRLSDPVRTESVSLHAGGLRDWSCCYFVLSFTASFVLSMASSTFAPAFSTGPFSGHALVASAIDDKARTTMTLRMIFILPSMTEPQNGIVHSSTPYV